MTSAASDIAIITDSTATPAELLDCAATAIGFDAKVRATLSERGDDGTVVIVPTMDGFSANSPAIATPSLVEHVIDRLYQLGATSVVVGSTEGSDALWAENRDVFMRADLLGYRYVTASGRDYDIVDLSDDAEDAPFPSDSALAGIPLSAIWQNAAIRIVFSANRTDAADGYALALDTLLSVLPGRNKDSLYWRQRDPAAVIQALLAATPVDVTFIDATISSHGHGGRARPLALDTYTIIAASDPRLGDRAGALKMGLDPQVSRLWRPLPAGEEGHTIGSLLPFEGWANVTPMARDAVRRRQKDAALDRSVGPLFQQIDTTLFPLRNEANARLNEWVNSLLSAGDIASSREVLAFLETILAQIAQARAAWQIMYDKDAIARRTAALNMCADDIDEAEWPKVAPAIASQRALLSGCKADEEGLRWRMVDGAVLFDCVRRFPVPLETFAAAVPIHRTIQFMNDYIGGEALAVASDNEGLVTRQLERNLYLPQPNFTGLLGGDVIDVTKIETVAYFAERQVMSWQTVFSENESALADDGLVEFAGVGSDTVVTIFARQHFRQPPLVEAFDLTLLPDLHAWLVTDAYRRFARRTFANLEAVLEGRNVRIGRPAAEVGADEPLPIDGLLNLVERVRDELPDDWMEAFKGRFDWKRADRPIPTHIDEDGLRHFKPSADRTAGASGTPVFGSAPLTDISRAFAAEIERRG